MLWRSVSPGNLFWHKGCRACPSYPLRLSERGFSLWFPWNSGPVSESSSQWQCSPCLWKTSSEQGAVLSASMNITAALWGERQDAHFTDEELRPQREGDLWRTHSWKGFNPSGSVSMSSVLSILVNRHRRKGSQGAGEHCLVYQRSMEVKKQSEKKQSEQEIKAVLDYKPSIK